MSQKVHLSQKDVVDLADNLASKMGAVPTRSKFYPIPRGGVPALYALLIFNKQILIAETPEEADYFLDDIIDSGATMEKYCEQYPGKPFFALIDKTDSNCPFLDQWVVFPWEASSEGSIEDNIRRTLQFIGEDPNREGLLETPKRVAKAYAEWFDGYHTDIQSLFKTFTDGAEHCDEMIIIDSIPVESFCEHHMARFHGVAHVAYIPDGKIIGLSKIPKLVKAFAHRLQVQERLTNQISDALVEHLHPKGVAVVVQCEHTCMSTRGARVHGTKTTTSSMRGAFLDNGNARAEFMSLIPKK
jgi:GTP cyclohydrolase I